MIHYENVTKIAYSYKKHNFFLNLVFNLINPCQISAIIFTIRGYK